MVDMYENEIAFKEIAEDWAGDDSEGLELLTFITPDNFTEEHFTTRNVILEKYGYGK